MTFLCLSTFLSLVFQQDAQSLLGEKRTECSFCGTSEKWSLEPLTSGGRTKCHQGISHLLRQIKQSLASAAHWQLPFKLPRDLLSPASPASSHCAELPTGQCHPLLWHQQQRRGKVPDPKGMSQSGQEQTLPWTCYCPVHQLTAADSCTKFHFHYHTKSLGSLKY